MHPDISAFPTEEFYDHNLKNGTVDNTGHPLPSLSPPKSSHLVPLLESEVVPSVVFLDHTGLESRKDKSRVNQREAAIVCNVVQDLLLQNPVCFCARFPTGVLKS